MTVCVYSFYHIIGEEDTTRFFLSTNYQVTHVTSPCSPSSQHSHRRSAGRHRAAPRQLSQELMALNTLRVRFAVTKNLCDVCCMTDVVLETRTEQPRRPSMMRLLGCGRRLGRQCTNGAPAHL